MNQRHVPFTGNLATSILYIPAQMLQLMINARKCVFCGTSAYKSAQLHCIAVDFLFIYLFFNYIRQVLTSNLALYL